MKAIGTNLSNASFIPTRPYRNARKHGGRYHRGMHDMLLAEDALPIVMQTMTMMMMKTIAMMATTTADTKEKAIATTHDEENSTNLLRHREALPLCTSNDRNLILLTLRNTIQSGGSMMRISAHKSEAACLNHSRFLGLDLEHPKLKLRFTIDNLRANIILTRMIQRSLA
jgi:hypothetical protein